MKLYCTMVYVHYPKTFVYEKTFLKLTYCQQQTEFEVIILAVANEEK